jgi:hypothetical protein
MMSEQESGYQEYMRKAEELYDEEFKRFVKNTEEWNGPLSRNFKVMLWDLTRNYSKL